MCLRSTEPPLLPNPCYAFVLLLPYYSSFTSIKNSLEIEYENQEIVKEIKQLEDKNFSTEVTLALTKVRDKLISINNFTVHFVIDNKVGKNVGDHIISNDDLYMHMVRESFKEVTNILKDEYGSKD